LLRGSPVERKGDLEEGEIFEELMSRTWKAVCNKTQRKTKNEMAG
jgi:hypothetical protein